MDIKNLLQKILQEKEKEVDLIEEGSVDDYDDDDEEEEEEVKEFELVE